MASAIPYSPGRLEFTFKTEAGFAGSVTFCAAVGDTQQPVIVHRQLRFLDSLPELVGDLFVAIGDIEHNLREAVAVTDHVDPAYCVAAYGIAVFVLLTVTGDARLLQFCDRVRFCDGQGSAAVCEFQQRAGTTQ